jgi:phosphatidate cytidylyltransferase
MSNPSTSGPPDSFAEVLQPSRPSPYQAAKPPPLGSPIDAPPVLPVVPPLSDTPADEAFVPFPAPSGASALGSRHGGKVADPGSTASSRGDRTAPSQPDPTAQSPADRLPPGQLPAADDLEGTAMLPAAKRTRRRPEGTGQPTRNREDAGRARKDAATRTRENDTGDWPAIDQPTGNQAGNETRNQPGNQARNQPGNRAGSQPGNQAGGPPASNHGKAGRNLPAAIGVGLGLAAITLASLFTRPEAFVALVSLVIVLAVWELSGAMAAKQIVVPVIPLAVGSLGMLVSAYVAGEEGLLVSFTLTGFGVLLWRIIDGMEGAIRDVTAGLFTAAYVPLLAGFAVLLLADPDGPQRVVTFIVVTVCSDIGGYVAGATMGKHPMAPTISPKKSWEGFAGSVVFCLIAGMACVVLLLGGVWWVGLALGAATALTATLGDLSESLLKRDLGVKDMGSLLPGHGGIMDRLDSLLPTAPVAYLLLHLLVAGT